MMMMQESALPRVVIVGAGFGGIAAAQRLSKVADEGLAQVVLIDKGEIFSVSASWQYALNKRIPLAKSYRSLNDIKVSSKVIKMLNTQITAVDPEKKNVSLKLPDGAVDKLCYDYLLLAPGIKSGCGAYPGIKEHLLDIANSEHIEEIGRRVEALQAGNKVLVCTSATPYKCPPSIFEYSFLIHDMLAARGIRESCSITLTTPGYPFPFGSPPIHEAFRKAVSQCQVEMKLGIKPVEITSDSVRFKGVPNTPFEGVSEVVEYDLLLGTWPQLPPEMFSPLCNGKGFIQADVKTMETKYEGLFAIGDVSWMKLSTQKPHPKSGVFAVRQAENACVMVESLLRGKTLTEARALVSNSRNGRCFSEAGEETGILIDFTLDLANTSPPKFLTSEPNKEVYEQKSKWLDDIYKDFFGAPLFT